jgi:Kef-type K+ transport system membrane component KefB
LAEVFAFFLAYLGVALIISKVLYYSLERLGIPGVLGEVLTGILLGAAVIGSISGIGAVMADDKFLYPFDAVAHMGIIFLLLIAGLEIEPSSIKRAGRTSLYTATGGIVVPFAFGVLAGYSLGFSRSESLVIGVILTATSIGITVRTFLRMGVLDTDVGVVTVSASVIDDFVGVFLIILIVGTASPLMMVTFLAIFLAVTLALRFGIRSFIRLAEIASMEKGTLAIVLGMVLIMSAIAEYTLAAAIEGAFIAGLMIRLVPGTMSMRGEIKTIGYAFFIPLFFIYVGTLIDPAAFLDSTVLVVSAVILIAAITGKIIGTGLGARLSGFSGRNAMMVGISSIPRVEIALVSLLIAIRAEVISDDNVPTLVAATMILVTVTTLITPILVRALWKDE